MTAIKAINRVIDHELTGYRYQIFRYRPAIQATAIITAAVHCALRWFDDHMTVIDALIESAAGDLTRNGPPRLLTSSYTQREAQACTDPDGEEARRCIRLSLMLISELESMRDRLRRELGDKADYCLMRRLLGSLLRTVPPETLLDCAGGLSRAEIGPDKPHILLTPECPEPKDRVKTSIDDFWRVVGDLPWTQEAYSLLLHSSLITACRRLSVSSFDVASLLEHDLEGNADRSVELEDISAGDVTSVPGLVEIARGFVDRIVDLAEQSAYRSEVIVARVAALMAPLGAGDFGRQLRFSAPEWEKNLPDELEAGRIALVIGDAPAVIV